MNIPLPKSPLPFAANCSPILSAAARNSNSPPTPPAIAPISAPGGPAKEPIVVPAADPNTPPSAPIKALPAGPPVPISTAAIKDEIRTSTPGILNGTDLFACLIACTAGLALPAISVTRVAISFGFFTRLINFLKMGDAFCNLSTSDLTALLIISGNLRGSRFEIALPTLFHDDLRPLTAAPPASIRPLPTVLPTFITSDPKPFTPLYAPPINSCP